MGGCRSSPLSDDRAPALATIWLRDVVLVDIRTSTGTVVLTHRHSPVVVSTPVGDLIVAARPLEPLLNVVRLLK